MVAVSRDETPCYAIRDFDPAFVWKKARGYRGPLDWIKAPVKPDDFELGELLESHSFLKAHAAYGLWWRLVFLAATLPGRDGRLVRGNGHPLTVDKIRFRLRIAPDDLQAMEGCLESLVAIGWLLTKDPDPGAVLRSAADRSRRRPRTETNGDDTNGSGTEKEKKRYERTVAASHFPSPRVAHVRRSSPEWERAVRTMEQLEFDAGAIQDVRDEFRTIDDAAVYRLVADAASKPDGFFKKSRKDWVFGSLKKMQREQAAATSDYLRSHGSDA